MTKENESLHLWLAAALHTSMMDFFQIFWAWTASWSSPQVDLQWGGRFQNFQVEGGGLHHHNVSWSLTIITNMKTARKFQILKRHKCDICPQRVEGCGHLQLRGRGWTAGQGVGCVALGRRPIAILTFAGCPFGLRQIGTLALPTLLLLQRFLRVSFTPCLLLLHFLDSQTYTSKLFFFNQKAVCV